MKSFDVALSEDQKILATKEKKQIFKRLKELTLEKSKKGE